MADVGLRDLGSFVPGGVRRSREPEAPPIRAETPVVAAAQPAVIVTPPPPQREPFGGDLATGSDALGIDATLAQIAELVAHRHAAVPLCIGLLGAAGSGKSFALGRLAQRIRTLAAAAAQTQGPFLGKIHVQPIDAAALDGDPATGIAARLHAGLRQPYPDLAREIAHTARDPHVVLRETNDKLDDARRRLDSERRALDDAGSRRARLVETVLYEAAGSQVDAYARANRAGIESRLTGFGIHGDPIRNYKDLVQVVAGSGGKLSLALRSLWAFKGQSKLIVAAIVLVGIGIGLGIAVADQTTWLGDLRSGPQAGTSVANWAQAHIGLLSTAKTAAFGLAVLALVANLWRAFAFLQPILKGARLLDHDLDNRRRDLDGLYAHQTKRVDALDADVERLTREVGEAERRAGGAGAANEPSPFETTAGAAQAQSFFAVLASLMAGGAGTIAAPKRIVLALDHLDALPPERGRAVLDTLHRLAGAGLVSLVALDPARIETEGGRHGDLERWIQVPVRVDAGAGVRDDGALVRAALGRAPVAGTMPVKIDAGRSVFDEQVGDDETAMLTALAELAGATPRAVKRFVNLYAIARLDGEVRRGALAFMLAVSQNGTSADRQAVAEALARRDHGTAFDLAQASQRLRAALEAVRTVDGRFTIDEAAAAERRAALFAIDGLADTGTRRVDRIRAVVRDVPLMETGRE